MLIYQNKKVAFESRTGLQKNNKQKYSTAANHDYLVRGLLIMVTLWGVC